MLPPSCVTAGELRGRGDSTQSAGSNMAPRPRFTVSEIEGFPVRGRPLFRQSKPMLSCSVRDTGLYGSPEVARFNEEDVRIGRNRQRERREAIRNRAAGLAAILNAEHAEPDA